VRVAVAQFATSADKTNNTDRAVARVAEAAALGAQLVVLPEATMCTFGPPTADLVPLAEPLDGPFVETVQRAAAKGGVTVVAGTFEPSPSPGKVYNTVVVVDPDGLVGAYRKIHLYDAFGFRESDRIEPGHPQDEGVVVFAHADLTFGVMTCYDLRFPEMARALTDRGATALLVPAHWMSGPGKADAWEVLLRARAIESTAYVLAAAKPGPEATGRSMVVDPRGVVLTALGADEDGVAVAELTAGRVDETRERLPVLAHRRFDVVGKK
jgi:predicted amidohydrolase